MRLFGSSTIKKKESSYQENVLKSKEDFLKMIKPFTYSDRKKLKQFAEDNFSNKKIKNKDILKKVRSELGMNAKIKVKKKFKEEYTAYQKKIKQRNLKAGMQDRIDASGLGKRGLDRKALGNVEGANNNGFASGGGKTGFIGNSGGSSISIFKK